MATDTPLMFAVDTESGSVEVVVYATDTAGNAPWMHFDVNGESSFSLSLADAKAFNVQLTEAIAFMLTE